MPCSSKVEVTGVGESETAVVEDANPIEAVRLAVSAAAKTPATGIKVAEVVPAGTVTDRGDVTTGLSTETDTAVPPAGAACESFTTHAVPPFTGTAAGEHWNEAIVKTSKDRLNVCEEPFSEAVIVAAG
jgi:hypothetical protein